MAGLKILLLWAGIISLANCQGSTISPTKPEDITSLTVEFPEHNVITVTCDYKEKHLNGPKKEYRARLHGVAVKVNKDKCFFEFKDLSYSTEYKLEVFVCNEDFCSKPIKESVSTTYSILLMCRLIIFVIIGIIASVVLVVAVYKIYVLRRTQSRSVVNEDVMLELTATYGNVPRSED